MSVFQSTLCNLNLLRPINHRLRTLIVRRPSTIPFRFCTTVANADMATPKHTYAEALALLDSLQSNSSVVNMVQTPGVDANQYAMPEMLDWVNKAGYSAADFNSLKIVHVAGTKGKGSVCAMVASILQKYSVQKALSGAKVNDDVRMDTGRGLGKVGLYTSPHLVTVRERIRIDGVPISQDMFTKYFFELWDRFTSVAGAAGHPDSFGPQTKPGYFRYLTIMALHTFLKEGIESAVVECGIGGEYDSTNFLLKKAVSVSAITRLGIDHVGMLGNNIESIAWHKAGIMKEGVRCFTVLQAPEAMQVLQQRVAEKGNVLEIVDRRREIHDGSVKLGINGEFQKDNASLAIAVAAAHLDRLEAANISILGSLPKEFIEALEEMKLDGRCQVRQEDNIEWCIDGAHTIDSIIETGKWFREHCIASAAAAPKVPRTVFNLMNMVEEQRNMLIFNQETRNALPLLEALCLAARAPDCRTTFGEASFTTNISFLHEVKKGADVKLQQRLADHWRKIDNQCAPYIASSSIEPAVDWYRRSAKMQPQMEFKVLVTGSLHLAGGFLKLLDGGKPETL